MGLVLIFFYFHDMLKQKVFLSLIESWDQGWIRRHGHPDFVSPGSPAPPVPVVTEMPEPVVGAGIIQTPCIVGAPCVAVTEAGPALPRCSHSAWLKAELHNVKKVNTLNTLPETSTED